MAYSLSPNLKLRVDTNLTANAKYNLLKIDELGSLAASSSAAGTVQLKSKLDLFLNANDPDLGGLGQGGNIVMGDAGSPLDSILLNATKVLVNGGFGFLDQAATNGNQEAASLTIQYKSNLTGAQDPQDVILGLDLENQDRQLVLAGNLKVQGDTQLISQESGSSVLLPKEGTLATLAGQEVLENKEIDGTKNTLKNISYSSLSSFFRLPGSQVDTQFGLQTVQTAQIQLSTQDGSKSSFLKAGRTQLQDLTITLPEDAGAPGQVLATDGTGTLVWVNKSATSFQINSSSPLIVPNQQIDQVSGAVQIDLSTPDQLSGTVLVGPTSGPAAAPSFRRLENQDVGHLVAKSGVYTWMPEQGAELVIQHNWGTRYIIVQFFDNLRFETLDGPSVFRVDSNRILIKGMQAPPAGGFTVLLHAVLS